MHTEVLKIDEFTFEEPLTLPREIKNEFKRDSVINSIKSKLNEKNAVVVLVGDKFTGKTTILKQFYQEFVYQTAAYFIQGDKYKDRVEFIFSDLCKQLLRMCSEKVQNKININDLDDYNRDRIIDAFGKIYSDLCIQAKRNKKFYYIIFDGIEELPEDVANEILAYLPSGDTNGVYVILSINTNSNLGISGNYVTLNVLNFSLAETQYILQEYVDDTNLIKRIHQFCNGLPAYINDFCVKIINDPQFISSESFETLPENYTQYINQIWGGIDFVENELLINIITVLLFAPENINLNECVEIFNITEDDILYIIKDNDFIRSENGSIFIPQIYSEFLKSKLADKKSYATGLLVKFYENQSLTDSKTVTFLSELYKEENNYSKLRELMTLQTINLNLEQLNETTSIRKSLGLLSEMSFYEEDWATYQKSIVTGGIMLEIKQTPPSLESEIKILSTLKKFNEAIKMTYMCSLEDDRAYLLSIICRALTKNGETIPTYVLEGINTFVDKIDIASDLSEDLIEKLVSISTNIFSADMQLALSIIKKIVEKSSTDVSKEKLMDYLLLKLFLKLSDDSAENSGIEEIMGAIDDSEIKDIINIATTTNAQSFSKVRSKLEVINDASAKMFYLINWCINHKTHNELLDVVEYTLNLFEDKVNHTLTLKDLRYLVETLENRNELERISEIINKVEKVKDSLNSRLKKEYVKLEISLSKLETKIELAKAQNRFLELIIFIESINELDIKCLGIIYLLQDGQYIMNDEFESYYDELKNKFNADFNRMLLQSANHYEISQEIFFELAKIEIDLAMIFFSKINTEKNRFRIFQQIIKAKVQTGNYTSDILDLINRLFHDEGYKDFLIFRLVYLLADNDYLLSEQELKKIKSLIMKIKLTQNKIISYSYLFRISYNYEQISINIYERIEKHIKELSLYEDKQKIVYYVIQNLNLKDFNLACRTYNLIKNENGSKSLLDKRLDNIHLHLISFLIKSLPKMDNSLNIQFYIKIICSNIDRCDSIIQQARLYNELGLKLIEANHVNFLEDFIIKYIEIFKLIENNFTILFELLENSGELLYLKNENYYFELLNKISYREIKEKSILNIVSYLATQKSARELVDLENLGLSINLEKAKKIVALIKMLKVDANVSVALKIFIQVLENSIKRSEYSIRELEALNFYKDIILYLEEILPDTINIQHKGYIILCKALFSKFRGLNLRNITVKRGLPSPEELYKEAKVIDNISDKIFVYCYIAHNSYKENQTLALTILEEAQTELEKIKNHIDKVDRAELIASTYLKIGNKNAAESIIHNIFEMIKKQNSQSFESENNYENLIELAYQINPQFAQTLSKNLDSPHESIEVSRTLQAMNYFTTPSKIKESRKKIPNKSLKSFYIKTLQSLNAGRGHIQTEKLIMETISKNHMQDLELTFLGLEWYIENLNRSNNHTSNLINVFNVLQEIIDFLFGLDSFVINNSELNPKIRKLYSLFNNNFTDNYVAGEGHKAKRDIINWINQNAKESLIIYDPYFSNKELDIFLEIHLKENIDIICTHKTIDRLLLKEMYIDEWTDISNQSPPIIHFNVLTSKDGVTPIHDRYIVGDNISLQLTTSINGFNTNDFKITELTEEQTEDIKNNVIYRTLNSPPKNHRNLTITTHKFYLE
ncbi:ATP-binding protein [Metasolibacillus fluoroglycofenilyticus]|uniref:ATP-binding protein n=1 Tax=Metasolibacillus fluoroglycofenilyticus TaxID=1239396 RepID=UPI000D36A4EC|nr:ATP-binding protein [Metasolibacillus fluoroglycofenilyticus]